MSGGREKDNYMLWVHLKCTTLFLDLISSLSPLPLRCPSGEACSALCGWPEHAQTGPLRLPATYWATPTVSRFWWFLWPWKTLLETDQGCHHLCSMCSSRWGEKSCHSTVHTTLCHVLSPLTLRSQPQGHFPGQFVSLIGGILKPAPTKPSITRQYKKSRTASERKLGGGMRTRLCMC